MSELKTEGQRLLRLALQGRGAQASLAKRVGVSASVVTRWLDGTQSPATKNRFSIAGMTEPPVPVQSWDQPPREEEEGSPAA